MIKSVFFPSGTGQFIELKLNTLKYDSILLTATGGLLLAPATGQIYPYRSVRAALKSGAVVRAKVTVKLLKKTRVILVVCDKDKLAGLKAALLPKKIMVGGATKVGWDVTDVVVG